MAEVGLIGLGRMGLPIGRRLVERGVDLVGFDMSSAAQARAAEAGIRLVSDPADLAACEFVLSSLPDTAAVTAVFGGQLGLLTRLAPGAVCLDHSTISVAGSVALAAFAADRGIAFLDAPLGGTSIHAEAGTLVVMVGGDLAALERARPLLSAYASEVRHLGPSGSGLEVKLVTNRLLTTHLVAIGEALVALRAAGLDVELCLDVLRAGPVPRLLDYKAGPMASRDFTPRFTVALMSKDLRLAAERRRAGQVTESASELMFAAEAAGFGELDIGVVIDVIQSAANQVQGS